MRKRNITHLFDTLFWYIIYFMPLIAYLLFLFITPGTSSNTSAVNFLTFINDVGFGILTDNVVITAFKDIFGTNGVLPLFNNDLIFVILGWFVCSVIIHLTVDFLLFIPRLAHKWLNKFTQGD